MKRCLYVEIAVAFVEGLQLLLPVVYAQVVRPGYQKITLLTVEVFVMESIREIPVVFVSRFQIQLTIEIAQENVLVVLRYVCTLVTCL